MTLETYLEDLRKKAQKERRKSTRTLDYLYFEGAMEVIMLLLKEINNDRFEAIK